MCPIYQYTNKRTHTQCAYVSVCLFLCTTHTICILITFVHVPTHDRENRSILARQIVVNSYTVKKLNEKQKIKPFLQTFTLNKYKIEFGTKSYQTTANDSYFKMFSISAICKCLMNLIHIFFCIEEAISKMYTFCLAY